MVSRVLRWAPSLLALASGLSLCAAFAQEAAPSPNDAQKLAKHSAAQLIEQLNASRLADRLAAENELLRRGPEILDQFPAFELLPNASVREAVRRIRISLERRKALASLEAATVSWEGELSLSELLHRLETGTGNRLPASVTEDTALRRNRVRFDKTPYWDAIDEVARLWSLRYAGDHGVTPLRLEGAEDDAEPGEKASARSGPFRLALISAQFRPLAGASRQRILRLRATLACEPRLRPLFLHYAAADLTLITEDGTPLRPYTPEAKYEVPLGNGGCWLELTFDFAVPEGMTPQAVRLDGLFKMLTAAGTEQFEFGDLTRSRNVSRRKGGVTVTFHKATEKPNGDVRTASVDLTIAYDVGGPAFESHRTWVYYNDAFLTRSDNARIEHDTGVSTEQQTDGAMRVGYGFTSLDQPLDRHRFVYRAPTLIVDVPVRFRTPAIEIQKP